MASAGEDILRALAAKQVAGFNSSPFSQGLTSDLERMGSSVAAALMAPGDALRGEYSDVEVLPTGEVSPFSQPLMDAASNMAGVVTLGSAPLPRPAGSLAMGMARIMPQAPPEGFPIQPGQPFPFMHNTEGAFNYVPRGSAATQLDPKGRFVIHDEGGMGRAPDERWVKGETQFSNPLYIQESGWKEKVSEAYGGATGKKLTALLKADGYDGIVTFDRYGPSEIVDLK